MRYKHAVREQLDRLIHDANMVGLTNPQTIQLIQERAGITVARDQVTERRRILRIKGREIWDKYRKDSYTYRLEHLDRMAEARRIKESAAQQMFKYENDEKKFFHWKSAAYAFIEASKYLAELTDHIPEIDAIGHGAMFNEMEQLSSTESTQSQEDTDPGNRQF
jgi:hypothetical protein